MPARKAHILAAAAILLALSACEGPGTIHVVRHPDGKIKESWTEKASPGGPSLREGLFRSFYSDGKREGEVPFRGGRKEGTARLWSREGRLVFEGVYRDDFLVREIRWDDDGRRKLDRRYATREAKAKALGPAGDSLEVAEVCAYLDEADGVRRRHGLCRMAYPDGKVLSTRYYQDGRLHGKVTAWHPDGKPWMEGAYDHGEATGPWKTWSAEGKPLWSARYAGGELAGDWREWHPDGKPKTKAAYRAGRPDGPYQEWYRNGNPRLSGFRKNGLREGVETAWYPDGGRLYEAGYRHGRLDGPFTQWHPDGSLRLQCAYRDGRKQGASRSWHRNGALMELAWYRDGRLDGPCKTFDADGRLLVTRRYRGGALAFDSRARDLVELLGAGDAKVPVGAFGFYWGMTAAECRGTLGVMQASAVRQDAEVLSARATVFADSLPRTAHLKLRFNSQGELWQIAADFPRQGESEGFALDERVEAEIGAELGKPELRRAEGAAGPEGWSMRRRRDWGRFTLVSGSGVPVRQDLPVVTAEARIQGPGAAFRFTLSNPLFREYVNPANASITPPEWPEETFLAGR